MGASFEFMRSGNGGTSGGSGVHYVESTFCPLVCHIF